MLLMLAKSIGLVVAGGLAALLVSGSCTERGTDGSAAWCSSTSQPRTAVCTPLPPSKSGVAVL